LLIAAKFNPNEEQTINYNEAARAHDPEGRYTHRPRPHPEPNALMHEAVDQLLKRSF